ncbi:MAG: 50S ribosomal protein L18 [Candidatus Kerfeldbacteria bacterium RIFOXYA2_FULL_38_24]|uniref:Large ribosomal subunit protein uL18 n=1 Tax=Candidatus Kerfeldbacteria bacterium RIFOXYB2_FULL_38_14 TaxID=1798547 RepID=A0A1G2BHI3_9BACT|nr:MAG: 50S ribosomal protein L18 [Candidatus Kerfeldbacteria bacterium RIFOXYB2_FULL_38_14]OGY87940.1 MAG: 50S ribosomal protein L18 [Candidatus Kerfeldbacteria bacterium RIFOXYA2_FULL_38_24]OGY88648.1 MAG: 50S ribosomal protein L18 [Candidatus Kerfeldbacteria bacterium RIFOXYC2_FULL_38_9]
MNKNKQKQLKKTRRAHRNRFKIKGTASIPRLSVYRSLKSVSAQLIDDTAGKTLVAANDHKAVGSKMEKASTVGKKIALEAKNQGVTQVVFDRGSYRYHGRIKALAQAARDGGLKF